MSELAANLTEECLRLIKKADRSLVAARRNCDAGDYDFASSRAYYALYYAIKAALLSERVTSSKHSGNISEFNRLFLKPGIFPKKYSKLVDRLFNERQIADYESGLSISAEDGRADLAAAGEIVEAIRSYLLGKDLLPGTSPSPVD